MFESKAEAYANGAPYGTVLYGSGPSLFLPFSWLPVVAFEPSVLGL